MFIILQHYQQQYWGKINDVPSEKYEVYCPGGYNSVFYLAPRINKYE